MVEELSDGGRWDVLSEYTAHAHRERPHQGKVVRIAVADPHPRAVLARCAVGSG